MPHGMAAPTLTRADTAIRVPSSKSSRVTAENQQSKTAYRDAEQRAETLPHDQTATHNQSPNPVRISKSLAIRIDMAQPDNEDRVAQSAIDPISRQIFERTHSQNKLSNVQTSSTASHTSPTKAEDGKFPSRQNTSFEADTLRRSDSTGGNKLSKDKKKGVSFLSRIIGGRKKDDASDFLDNASESFENRPLGTDAEVFSQPIGFIPKFPAPPRYIRVKAQNRKKREFDRLFLAQILADGQKRGSRKSSLEVDSKILDIDESPAPPNSAKTASNAIWASEFSKDGQYFAAAGQDKKLRVWRIVSSKEEREGDDLGSSINNENEPYLKLNAPVFKQELVREYDGHTSAILDLSWSKNNFLLSSSMDKTVRLYHVSRSECLCAFKHNDFVTSIHFHPCDDRFFLAGSLDSRIRLWSIPDKNVAYVAHVPDMVTAVSFTPDGKTAIAGTLSGLCILYDVDGLKPHSQIHVRSNRGKNAKGSKITGIDTIAMIRPYGPPDTKILITSNDSRVRVYNMRDRSLEAKFRGNENNSSQIRATFSDDGKYVICGSEDKRVYVWPTDSTERQDADKRPLECFEAHSGVVTTAILAPMSTRRLLARSNDPIYDLCNPPPVKLFSRTDSVPSSQPGSHNSGSDEQSKSTRRRDLPSPTDESPQYLGRQSHNDGHIIVTADITGQIKVFRQDCAYQKRRDGSWDMSSSFSKKMLRRSGSVVTRTSVASSSHRNSLSLSSKNPSTDRILNWRNSVVSAKSGSAATSVSDINLRTSVPASRERSISPGKRQSTHRLSLRHGSTPLTTSETPTNLPVTSPTPETKPSPAIMIEEATPVTGQPPESPNYYSASEHRRESSIASSLNPAFHESESQVTPKFALNDEFTTPEQSGQHLQKLSSRNGNTENENDNDLYLVGSHSYMAWDYKNTILPMLQTQPRTPNPNSAGAPNPMSREASFVSQLSSERRSSGAPSSVGTPRDERSDLPLEATSSAFQKAAADRYVDLETDDGEELQCRKCGNESFRLVKSENGITNLRCRRCSAVL